MVSVGLSPADRSRLNLVKNAVDVGDFSFLLLNQFISCVCLGEPHKLPRTDPPLDVAAISLADRLLGGSSNLSPYVLSFLQSFPFTLENIDPNVCVNILVCLRQLILHYDPMVRHFAQLKTLPLARDLHNVLAMPSICLQRYIFRAILSAIWGTNVGILAEEAMNHFVHEQSQYNLTKHVRNVEEHYRFYNNLTIKHFAVMQQLAQRNRAENQASWNSNAHLNDTSPPVVHSTNSTPVLVNSPLTASSANRRWIPFNHPPSHSSVNQRRSLVNPSTFNSRSLPLPESVPSNANNNTPTQVSQHRLRQAASQRTGPSKMLILPSNAEVRIHAQPDHRHLALHQAHLRDPILEASEAPCGTVPGPVYFRYVSDFALSPQNIGTRPIQEFQFNISAEQLALVPRLVPGGMEAPQTAVFNSSSVSFRVKCCQSAKGAHNTWFTNEAVWPIWLHLSLNGNPLEFRRKTQFGKCLPVDINSYVRETNELKVFTILPSDASESHDFSVAVEIVVFSNRETIKHDCLTKRSKSAEEIQSSIVSLLAKIGDTNDDDVAIVQSNIVIPLFEPFSNARIFDIPVRGADCTHRQAMDLDVFLESRACEGEASKISKVDGWKCAICGGDARPHVLIVDGFLQQVRETLEATGRLKTRTITVESDGRFKAVQEAVDAADSDEDDEESDTAGGGPRRSMGRDSAVIEIDSD